MSVDLSALNLTELVNGMLIRALKDSKKFFSLLSVTSYSSFAFHKFSVAIYNISNLKTVDPAKFPTRYCYCLNNRTNDLSDFTALLVDIVGNSTSYLTEIFKSTSILSVSQANESDCIFICVMSGKSGRNLSDFWEMAEKSPVINYTFTSSMSGVLEGEQTMSTNKRPEGHSRAMARATTTLDSASPTLPAWATRKVAGTPWVTAHRQAWASTLPVPWAQATKAEEATNTRSFSETPAKTVATPGSPSGTSSASGCPEPLLKEGAVTPAPLTLAIQKLNPCLMELCRFFQQCLCMSQKRDPRMEAVR
ncbi:hypothetical protein J1605_007532 [Eschrichtius robustus]|uniref:HERV-H LTR-associating protein 1 n=1 Tax=Eschrichtius robustus TaxID=9764 RepID=A0AB34GWX0_ESCRO|nr:hypothetical protein J1605_007532 [Eschrichtius robustus]